ncbi:DUF2231 domain-containing protein [Streptomyces sp. NPDC016566]|uniref:DUF2231 domain-containing protein n=1 Tax=Streptomyces sp. NPDC016566 TaxID=3364967 RepID=UPI0036FB4FFD
MDLTVINGLPAHVLLVHAVVVLIPLTAIALAICALWTSWAKRLGLALPALGLITLAFVPLTAHAGEWLEQHVDSDPLVRRHTELGDGLLPWALGMFLVSVLLWWRSRRSAAADSHPSRLGLGFRTAAVAVSLAVGAGAVVQTYRIGESGAKAAWHDGFSATATGTKG